MLPSTLSTSLPSKDTKKHPKQLILKFAVKDASFFSMKFATTLDFTGFPVISHLFTDGLTILWQMTPAQQTFSVDLVFLP